MPMYLAYGARPLCVLRQHATASAIRQRPQCSAFARYSCGTGCHTSAPTAPSRHGMSPKQPSVAAYTSHTQCRFKSAFVKYPTDEVPSTIVSLPSRDITLADLASRIPHATAGSVMILVSELGVELEHGVDTTVSQDIAEFIVSEMGFVPQLDCSTEATEVAVTESDKASWSPRPPIVTIMGHVDHGKTTLLDYLRQTSVAAGEAGGITQHIGAFQATLPNTSGPVTFLDTPGHAAFTAMRSRGALATDIVVLVVAADDGVMPQTVESIRLAQQAKVPIVVAINKCDLPHAKPLNAKSALLNHGIQLEEFGGEVVGVDISALRGHNIDELQEAILLTADMANLRADFEAKARGLILEVKTKHGLGSVATALVRNGTLKTSDTIMAGMAVSRVRIMHDHNDKPLKAATPGMPVQIMGWKTQPHPGDVFNVMASEKEAVEVINQRSKMARDKAIAATNTDMLNERKQKMRTMVEDLQQKKKALDEKYKDREKTASQDKAYRHEVYMAQQASRREKDLAVLGEKTPELCVILKGDVQGSIDALQVCIGKYHDERVKLTVVHSGIGNVIPSDIQMAKICKGNIYCLNTVCDKKTQKLADKANVSVYPSKVIYKLIDLMKTHLDYHVEGKKEEVRVGTATVQAIFNITGLEKRHVAGCMVNTGKLSKELKMRVFREKEVVYFGRISTLQHMRDEVASISADMECGLSATDINFEFAEGDKIEQYTYNETKESVQWQMFTSSPSSSSPS